MDNSEFLRIRQKMLSLDVKRYWGDDFDVRFYMISKLSSVENNKILDLGGGIGIISSELKQTNLRINLDFSFNELKICQEKVDPKITLICASMVNIPFKDKLFDYVISASVIQYLRRYDITKNNVVREGEKLRYPSVEKCLDEIYRVLKPKGTLFLATPNNSYYRSYMFDYNELKLALSKHFSEFRFFLYNTYPRISEKNRKLNLAHMIPKIRSKFTTKQKLLESLLKEDDDGFTKNSVSFYVEATRN